MEGTTMIYDYGRSYLRLTLEINKHIDGFVDAYYGPDDLKAAVEDASKREPAALLDDVAALQAAIPGDDPARQAYLQAELRAIECSVRMLNGEKFDYLEEVNRLYDISPQPYTKAVSLLPITNWTRSCPAAALSPTG